MAARDFRPAPGDLILVLVAPDDSTPDGWHRAGPTLIQRVYTGDEGELPPLAGYVRSAYPGRRTPLAAENLPGYDATPEPPKQARGSRRAPNRRAV